MFCDEITGDERPYERQASTPESTSPQTKKAKKKKKEREREGERAGVRGRHTHSGVVVLAVHIVSAIPLVGQLANPHHVSCLKNRVHEPPRRTRLRNPCCTPRAARHCGFPAHRRAAQRAVASSAAQQRRSCKRGSSLDERAYCGLFHTRVLDRRPGTPDTPVHAQFTPVYKTREKKMRKNKKKKAAYFS